jgi:hypothetical protein
MSESGIQLNLTKEQLKIVLESLLFHSSVDINSRWCKDECDLSYDLAKNIRQKHPKILTENVYIFKEDSLHDDISKKIVDLFPETLENIPYI